MVIGRDQLGWGALTVLGLHWEGFSENHRQRLWGTRQRLSGERAHGEDRELAAEGGQPALRGLTRVLGVQLS